ncbi:MAG: hypothetical protein V6S10_00325 [Candidatus Methanoglobus sp.]
MRTKKFLISFSGIDGSGKTTLARSLTEELSKRGLKCQYIYGRLRPLVAQIFILAGRIFLKKKDKSFSEFSSDKRKFVKKHTLLSRIYMKVMLLDYLLQLFFKVTLPYMFGKNMICDRYVYDTIINDFAVDMGLSIFETSRLIERLFKVAPKPTIAFLIDVPEEIAFKRKSDIPSLDYLRERRRLYLSIKDDFGILVLDGSKDLKEVKESLFKVLAELKIA